MILQRPENEISQKKLLQGWASLCTTGAYRLGHHTRNKQEAEMRYKVCCTKKIKSCHHWSIEVWKRFDLCQKWLEITGYWYILDSSNLLDAREKEKHTQETETKEKCLTEKKISGLARYNTGTRASRYLMHSTEESPNPCHLQSKSCTGSRHPPQMDQDRKSHFLTHSHP